tara:strand:+ start:2259 stop:5087 length:2829 start_codon:yes stop_codon:yes gene_type:complete
MAQDLKDMLNLPKTDFPMRANLVKREPEWIKKRDASHLYHKIQEKNSTGTPFILHDGPPFTNGDVHIGTALNKILKDILVRYKSMKGFRSPYIPGWDCHGLPIEHKVMKELKGQEKELNPIEIRKACTQFSESFIEKQRGQFCRLGIMADWAQEYRTMDPAYEADILRTLASFIDQDLVYQSKKPVYWSIPCQTALAELEVEYKDHVSPSIWVTFKLRETSKHGLPEDTYCVIWTTTPWTLPANQALAVHPELQYVSIEHEGSTYLVAEALAESFIAQCKLEGAILSQHFQGKDLEGWKAQHPFINRKVPIILADFVTTDSGTGCVHCAPGHGPDDYIVGLQYKLPIYSPIDDGGCYIDDGEIPASLVGLTVGETNGKNPANIGVLKLLSEHNALLHKERLEHSYPFCWRSKTPVIFRAMDQWFVALNKDGLRERVVRALQDVDWVPSWGETRIRSAVESRPDWCISRQRTWGVPLPVLYDEDKQAYLDASVVRQLADKIEKYGTDIWFSQSGEELLSGIDLPASWKGKTLTQGIETIDVWIESGASHKAVLKRNPDLTWPADLYLEGTDQHRGWFLSSLWTGTITEGKAPYKQVITHGFVVDENRRKISKSGEKPQTADMYVQQFGADIVRLWIASEDYHGDIPLSDDILKQITQTYRTIRNTLRFQLGNLYDFDSNKDTVKPGELTPLDQWAIKQTSHMLETVTKAYEEYAFHRVYQHINRFCTVTLSAIYHDILKDRLYTSGPNWKVRRSSQTAIRVIFDTLTKILAPILTFTSDEAYAYALTGEDYTENSIHCTSWPKIDSNWYDIKTVDELDLILNSRNKVHEKLEEARQAKTIGQSLDARISIEGNKDDLLYKTLKKHEASLPELFIASQVELVESDTCKNDTLNVTIEPATGERCPHSWRWVPKLVPVDSIPGVCVSPRSRDALLDRLSSQPVLK